MNIKFQPKNFSSSKENKNNRYAIILNSIIILLIILITFMSFSLILKLQNLNSYNKLDNSKRILSKPVQVEVLNGCGLAGAADKVTNFLRNKKFDVVQMGNYRTFDIDESIVIDRKGNIKIAEDIADSLGINRHNVIQQVNKNYLLDVSVVVGKDYKQLIR